MSRVGSAPVLLLALLAGSPAGGTELLVAAAASLRAPASEIARHYERVHPSTRITLTFGASSLLARQIEVGAPVDVFLSADERSVRALAAGDLLRERPLHPFAGNRLVVVLSAGLAPEFQDPRDLLRPEVRRFALPPDAVPMGHYARHWLARRGLLDGLLQRAVRTENARATLAAVDLGHADAAVVYVTDAALARSARSAFAIPDSEQPPIRYVAAITRRSRHPQQAELFLRYLTGPGMGVLIEAGFTPPPEAPP